VLQIRVDGTAPVVTVTVPAQGGSYGQGQVVNAAYTCADPASGVATCAGTVANSAPIDTSTSGLKTFVVSTSDVAGNVAEISVAYTVTTSATGPDLLVTALTGVPSSVVPGGRFSVTDTVLNQGNAIAGASTTRYYISENTQKSAGDTLFTVTRAVVSRGPGQISTGTRALTVPMTMTPGTYYVLACADDLEKVTEINEANNCRASSAVVVVGRPDLVATAVSNPPPVVTPGGTFSVTDTVANQGTAMSGASTTRYYVSPTPSKTSASKLLTGTRAVASLAPGAPPSQGTKTVTVPTTTLLGTYYLLACADDLARVIELNESGNCAASATQVTVTRPDLTVTVLSNPPTTAAKGSKFGITETVSNEGLVGAGPSTTRYYMSLNTARDAADRLLMGGSRAVPAIGAGSAHPAPAPVMVTVPTTVASGTYYVLACADDLRRVTEANETNNCRVSTTTVVVP